jgi:hypothetical protein
MLKLYVATVFLLHGLSPSPGVAFGFLVAALALLMALPYGRLIRRDTRFRLDDGLAGAIFLLGLLPLVLYPGRAGTQNLIYASHWLATWTVCCWWVREWTLASRIRFEEISQAAAFGAMLLAVGVLVEFALANTAGLYLSDFIPFSINEFPMATVLGEELRRPRGFTAEAGFSAIVFECLLPLSIAWLRLGRLRRWLFGALTLPAYLLLFSAASMLLFAVTMVVFLGLSRGWTRSVTIGAVVAAAVAVLAVTSDGATWLLYEVIARKLLEFTPEEALAGVPTFTRPEAYALAWTIMTEQPWGIGWGGVSQAMADNLPLFGVDLRGSGLISIPLEIGASAGVLSLLVYVGIVARKLARLTRIDSLEARLVFVSLMWVALHHAVVLELWFPMIWLSLALADVVAVRAAGQPAGSWRRRRARPAPRRASLAPGAA